LVSETGSETLEEDVVDCWLTKIVSFFSVGEAWYLQMVARPCAPSQQGNPSQWLVRLTANATVATALGSNLAFTDTVQSEGRQMKQCRKLYMKSVLRIRIRDPVPFGPLDPGSGIGFFRIPDPGSDHYY